MPFLPVGRVSWLIYKFAFRPHVFFVFFSFLLFCTSFTGRQCRRRGVLRPPVFYTRDGSFQAVFNFSAFFRQSILDKPRFAHVDSCAAALTYNFLLLLLLLLRRYHCLLSRAAYCPPNWSSAYSNNKHQRGRGEPYLPSCREQALLVGATTWARVAAAVDMVGRLSHASRGGGPSGVQTTRHR